MLVQEQEQVQVQVQEQEQVQVQVQVQALVQALVREQEEVVKRTVAAVVANAFLFQTEAFPLHEPIRVSI